MSKKLAKKVLVIGWDAADWKVIMPLVEQGKMPTLAKFMSEGVHGTIKTLDPPLSPMLWTSMATGYRADKHGITGFVEPLADNSGLRPVTSTSRKTRAIWNILHNQGMKSNVVSWWPSNPAEPINGVMVSNHYQVSNKPIGENWDMPDGTIYPESMIDILKKQRVHPEEMTAAHLLPFMPNLKEMDKNKEKRVKSVANIIAQAASVHAASTYLQRETEWDFMAVYHDAIDHFCHAAMKFHPPQRPGIPDEVYNNYKDVVVSGYLYQDMMLERTLNQLDDDTTVIIVSDHGFHSDHLRPKYFIKEPASPAQEHSPFGMICMRGPGIKKGEKIYGASVLDLTPTILALYGLPIGETMEGRPLVQAFDEEVSIDTIPDWEKVEGDFGMHSTDLQEDPWAAQEAMQQLIELGYIEAPGENIAQRIEDIKNESKYYVARNVLEAGKINQAIEILEPIFEQTQETRYGQKLAHAYLSTKKFKKCRALIEKLKEKQIQIKAEEEKLSEKELAKKKKGFLKEIELPNYIDYVEGLLSMNLNRPKKALKSFMKVAEKAPNSLSVALNIGKVSLMSQNWTAAQDSFIKVLAIDESNSFAHHGLGVAFLRQNKLEEALGEFLTATEFDYFYPKAHYHIGETLAKLEKNEEAAQAFELAISMSPGMTKAHKWLIDIYKNRLNQLEKAVTHENFIKEKIKGEIVIVSGLPRSGTSMMMQILDKGGYDVLTDKVRESDTNNPKGYYEFEPVKKLMVDKSWLPEAEGKVVKIIAQLLPFLPSNYDYKIIFMRREMSEVLKSQQIMLGKEGDVKSKVFPTGLNDAFQKQLVKVENWIDSQPNVEMLSVDYSNVIANAEEEIDNVISFLAKPGKKNEMIKVVDKKLYRNRS